MKNEPTATLCRTYNDMLADDPVPGISTEKEIAEWEKTVAECKRELYSRPDLYYLVQIEQEYVAITAIGDITFVEEQRVTLTGFGYPWRLGILNQEQFKEWADKRKDNPVPIGQIGVANRDNQTH